MLYFSVGKYISENTRNGVWGEDALGVISKKLEKEMTGLRCFSVRRLKKALPDTDRLKEPLDSSDEDK